MGYCWATPQATFCIQMYTSLWKYDGHVHTHTHAQFYLAMLRHDFIWQQVLQQESSKGRETQRQREEQCDRSWTCVTLRFSSHMF